MIKFLKIQFAVAVAVSLSLFFNPCIDSAKAGIKPGMTYKDGRLTLDADQAPLSQLLEIISKSAGVDIFVSKSFNSGNVSIQVTNQPLEDALKSMLRGYNYAAVYTKEGDKFRITALKIYNEGQQGGEVVPLFTGQRQTVFGEGTARGETRTVLVNSGGEVISRGGLENQGLLAPSQTEIDPGAVQTGALQSPWFAMKVQLDQQEKEKFQELQMLRKQMESANDSEKKKALTMIYADEMSKFYAMKRANTNKVEALKRITQFKTVTGQ
jgi:hypothetical protein